MKKLLFALFLAFSCLWPVNTVHATVTACEPARWDYNGNGTTTAFAYTCRIVDQAHLEVIKVSASGVAATQTIGTHYTVSGVGNAGGGNVTFITAPATGEKVAILRKQPREQLSDYIVGEGFPSERVERDLDKLAMMVQQHEEIFRRVPRIGKQFSIIDPDSGGSAGLVDANKFFGGPASGAAAAPAYRLLVAADIPNLNLIATGLTGSRCVETTAGGLLTVASAACGSGSGDLTDVLGTTNEITITNGTGPQPQVGIAGTPDLSTKVFLGGSPLVFEGATANDFETTFTITDPTADRTITFPDVTGEVSLLGQTITGSEMVNDTVGPTQIDETAAYTWTGGPHDFSGATVTGLGQIHESFANDDHSAINVKYESTAGAPAAGSCDRSGQIQFDTTNSKSYGCYSAGGNPVDFGTQGDSYNQITGDSGSASASGSEGLRCEGGTGMDCTATAGSPDKFTVAIDVNGLTEDTTPDEANDFFVTYDASATTHKKVKPDNIQPNVTSATGTLPVANTHSAVTTRSVTFRIGSDTGSALADTNDEATMWRNNIAAMTITEVWCESDAGSPIINLQRDDGTPANILSSNLTCSTSGATGTIAGAEDNLAVGDKIDVNIITAGGTAKRVTVGIKATLD